MSLWVANGHIEFMGLFARSFVALNRIMGWALAIFGILVIAGAIQRLALGRFEGFGLGWHFLFGATCLAAGGLYIRAPLFRVRERARDDAAD
jgi:hypothetical protein